MRQREVNPTMAWIGLTFGGFYAILCTVLILTGVVGGTLWFTVVGMVLLAVSSFIQIIRRRRQP